MDASGACQEFDCAAETAAEIVQRRMRGRGTRPAPRLPHPL